jgi:hypothetical protein
MNGSSCRICTGGAGFRISFIDIGSERRMGIPMRSQPTSASDALIIQQPTMTTDVRDMGGASIVKWPSGAEVEFC